MGIGERSAGWPNFQTWNAVSKTFCILKEKCIDLES